METYENGLYKIQRKDFKKVGRWEYCFLKGNEIPDGVGLAVMDYLGRLSKECPDPLPYCIINSDYASGQAGSKQDRMWVSIRGNIHSSYLIPRSVVKTPRQYNFFPMLTSFAIRDVLNKYAPDAFACKFPNDVICKAHESKIAGLCSIPTPRFVTTGFVMNLIAAPPEHLLRKEGLKACCLKTHTSNLPEPEKLLSEVGDRLLELNDEINGDVDKFLTHFNDAFIPYVKKRFKIVVNNANADVEKDGTLWAPDWPNALFKGFLNDEPFDSSEWAKKDQFWDGARFHIKDKDDPNFKDVFKKVKEYEDSVNKK